MLLARLVFVSAPSSDSPDLISKLKRLHQSVCVCACACRSSFFSVYPSFCLSIYIISHPCICCTCFPMCIYQSIYLPTYRHVCVDIGRKCTWLSIFVDPKVHIEIVHCKGRQGSKRRPRKVFIWVRESLSFFTQKAKYFNMRPPRKINVGFAKDSQNFFYSRRMAVCRKRNLIGSTATYLVNQL